MGGETVKSHYCCNNVTRISSLTVILLGFRKKKKILPVYLPDLLTRADPMHGVHTLHAAILPELLPDQQAGTVYTQLLPTCASNEGSEKGETHRLLVRGLAQLPPFIIFGVPHPKGELK